MKRSLASILALPVAVACGSGNEVRTVEPPPVPTATLAGVAASQPAATAPSLAGQTPPSETEILLPSLPAAPAASVPSFGFETTAIEDLVVVRSKLPARPIIGGTLLVLDEAQRVIVADPDRDQVYVVELESNMLTATIALESGDVPARLARGSDDTVYVALRGGDAVVSIDSTAGTVLERIPTCNEPRGVAFDAARNRIVVACLEGQVRALDATSHEVVWQTTLADDLRDVVVTEASYWVSRLKSAELLAVDPDGEGEPRVLSPQTVFPSSTAPLNSDGSIPSSPGLHVPRVLRRVVAHPSGSLVLHHQRANRGRLVTAQYGRDSEGGGAIAHGAVTVFNPTTEEFAALGALPNAQVYDIAMVRDGSSVAALSTGYQSSYLHLTSTADRGELSVDIGTWTTTEIAGQASAVAFDFEGRALVQLREPAALEIVGIAHVSLSSDSRFDTGHTLFHASTPAGLACASCHPEGGDDGISWDFGGTELQTQPLYVGVMSTTPLHWQGQLADMQALMRDTFVTRMQAEEPNPAQTEALGLWLEDLRPPRAAALAPDVLERGQLAFAAAKCGTCHSGDHLTDGTLHDVGTGAFFQTPSLIGLRFSAPYMHDGCAPTLMHRFDDACGGAAHGDFGSLSNEDVDALVAYLGTL